MNYLRKKMKAVIWLVIILFIASLFLLGSASFFMDAPRPPDEADPRTAGTGPGDSDKTLDTKAATPMARINLDGQSSVVTEGEVNALINQIASVRREASAQQIKMFFSPQIVEQLVRDKLITLAAQDLDVDISKELLQAREEFNRRPDSQRRRLLRDQNLTAEQYFDHQARFLRQQKVFEKITAGRRIPEESLQGYYELHRDEFKDEAGKPLEFAQVRTRIEGILRAQVEEEDVQQYYERHKDRWRLPPEVAVDRIVLDPAATNHAAALVPGEDEIGAFYEKNKEQFQGDARVVLRHIFIDPDHPSMRDAAPVTAADVESSYREHADRYRKPEQVKVTRILLKVPLLAEEPEKEAVLARGQELHEKITAGTPFEDVARESSEEGTSVGQGEDLGWIERDVFSPRFDEVAFSLAEGSVGEAFLDEDGVQILKVTGKESGQMQPLEEVADAIRKELAGASARKAARSRAEELAREVQADPASFEELARQNSHAESASRGGDLGTLALGENRDHPAVAEVGTHDYVDYKIQEAVSELPSGSTTGPVESSLGYHVLKVEQSLPPEPQPLEDVRDAVTRMVETEKKTALMRELRETVRRELESGAPFEEVARNQSSSSLPTLRWDRVALDAEEKQTLSADEMGEIGVTDTLPQPILRALQVLEPGEISEPLEFYGKTFMFHLIARHPPRHRKLDTEIRKDIVFALNPVVEESEVRSYFEEHKDELAPAVESTLEWVAVPEKYQAELLLKDIAAGNIKTFEGHPQYQSYTGHIANSEMRKAAASIEPGQFNKEPLKTRMGYLVLRSRTAGQATVPSYEDASGRIRQTLLERKKQALFEKWITELENRAVIDRSVGPSIL